MLISRSSLLSRLIPRGSVVAASPVSVPNSLCHPTRLYSTTLSGGKGNCFAFFDVAPHPELDVASLQKRYHVLQMQVHPDTQAAAAAQPRSCVPSAEQGGSEVDIAVYANSAYDTLRNPYKRCRYLSVWAKEKQVLGRDLTTEEEEGLLVDDDRRTMRAREVCPDVPLSEEFLMEMMAMNELIFAGDRKDEDVRNQMKVLQADLEERWEEAFDTAKTAWGNGDMQAFHHNMQVWTYINNALHHLKDRL